MLLLDLPRRGLSIGGPQAPRLGRLRVALRRGPGPEALRRRLRGSCHPPHGCHHRELLLSCPSRRPLPAHHNHLVLKLSTEDEVKEVFQHSRAGMVRYNMKATTGGTVSGRLGSLAGTKGRLVSNRHRRQSIGSV